SSDLFFAGLITQEGHVYDKKRSLYSAPYRAPVVDHLLDRHRQRCLESGDNVAKRITDEHHVDTRGIHQFCKENVVRGDDDNAPSIALHFDDVPNRDSLRLSLSHLRLLEALPAGAARNRDWKAQDAESRERHRRTPFPRSSRCRDRAFAAPISRLVRGQ